MTGLEDGDKGLMLNKEIEENRLSSYNIPTGGELKVIRESLGLSPEQVSDRLSMSETTIFKWEAGRTHPTTDKLRKMLAFYKIVAASKGIDEEED